MVRPLKKHTFLGVSSLREDTHSKNQKVVVRVPPTPLTLVVQIYNFYHFELNGLKWIKKKTY